jgi:hypothetical protein
LVRRCWPFRCPWGTTMSTLVMWLFLRSPLFQDQTGGWGENYVDAECLITWSAISQTPWLPVKDHPFPQALDKTNCEWWWLMITVMRKSLGRRVHQDELQRLTPPLFIKYLRYCIADHHN